VPVVRLQMVKDRTLRTYARTVANAADAARVLREFLEGADREHFVVMTLDTKHIVTGLHVVSIGTLSATAVHPREVFKVALLANAAAVILGHNHPSGDPTPSAEDVDLTRRLVEAGRLVGIEVLDHVIVGDDVQYVSLRERREGGF
jgi:DNA repair protein RadC